MTEALKLMPATLGKIAKQSRVSRDILKEWLEFRNEFAESSYVLLRVPTGTRDLIPCMNMEAQAFHTNWHFFNLESTVYFGEVIRRTRVADVKQANLLHRPQSRAAS